MKETTLNSSDFPQQPEPYDPLISIPASLFERFSVCYYGGGPRHPSAPDQPAPPSEVSRVGDKDQAVGAVPRPPALNDDEVMLDVRNKGEGQVIGTPRGFAARMHSVQPADGVPSGEESPTQATE